MDRITALPRGMQLMALGGLLLLIDSFFKWQEVEVLDISAGVNAWHGWGVLVGLLTIALLVWLAVRAFATDIELPLSDSLAARVLGALILLTTVLKILVDNEFRTAWAWFGLLFAVLIAVGAWQVTAGGGMETVRAESAAPAPPPQAPPSSEAAPPPPQAPPPPAQAPPSSEAAPPPPPSTDEP